jgi:capsular exopolysaccharide synthesis family protein
MPEDNLEYLPKKKTTTFTPKELLLKYVHYFPWIIVSVCLMMALAFLKLRYSAPMFLISGKLLAKTNNPFTQGHDKFDDIFASQSRNNNVLTDEMEVIRSRSMAARVVNALNLQTQYFNKGNIRTTSIHWDDVPFNFRILEWRDSLEPFSIRFTIVDQRHFRLYQDPKMYNLGDVMNLPFGTFTLVLNKSDLKSFASNEFIITYSPTESRAAQLSGQVKVSQLGDIGNVILLTYEDENPKIALDIINQFMTEYQKSTLEDKRLIAVNTANFIDQQLGTVKIDLGSVERNLQDIREKGMIFAPEEQSKLVFSELQDGNVQLTSLQVKISVLDTLAYYISGGSNPYRVVPATMGIEEPSLVQQVTEYNRLVLQREVELKSTPETNPMIRNFEIAIAKLRSDIQINLNNIRKSYIVALSSIQGKTRQAGELISKIPQKEKQLLEVTRQQKILEELYSFLLQKKLETAISSASTISNIKVLEPAMSSGTPVSPNRRSAFTLFLFLGLAIPAGIITLVEYLNDKVKTKSDIEKDTETPILGEIGHAGGGVLVVERNNRQFIAEQFRAIRSNLRYIMPKVENPVIMVTSSMSGEGKSFLCTNLGAVLAVSGKKTAIMEFDIRRPKLMEGLGLHERLGITNYLVGNISINDIIYPVPKQDNLYIIPCGPIPPNPAEMLLDEKVAKLFKELNAHFDAIIIDTAPVGLVSDAIIIGQYAHACMYVVRHNYTFKKQMNLIDDLYTSKKLPHLAIIINDIQTRSEYGSYGYGYYGYSYGHGGASYFENDKQRPKGLFEWIKNIFSR